MVSKTMSPSNFGTLLLNKLRAKKNWFIISFAILLVTVVILPLLMTSRIRSENIIIGMVEIFIIVFVNCTLDFSYLHDSRKLAYYASKPITSQQSINLNIATNIVLAAVLIIALLCTGFLTGVNDSSSLAEIYIVAIPWLLFGIFVAALSSVLTGNTIAAAIATILNFALPATFLAIFYFIFDIVEDVALGFSSRILMETFVSTYYKIDHLYLIKYAEDGIKWPYFVIILIVTVLLYLVEKRILKRRKNERAGDFIVYHGYQNFITVLIASLVPIGFLTVLDRGSFLNKIISFVLLSALAYYIISAILVKSFRLSKGALKIYVGFIGIFLIAVLAANISANRFESYTPNANDVQSVYLGNSTWVALEYKENGENATYTSYRYYDYKDANGEEVVVELQRDYPLYHDIQNIQTIIDLQKSIIKDQSYSSYSNVVITYIMKDGKNITRLYDLEMSDNYDGEKDAIMRRLITSNEYKTEKLPFVYDDAFAKSLEIKNIQVSDDYGKQITIRREDINVNALREALQKDYNAYFNNANNLLIFVTSYDRGYYYIDNNETYSDIEVRDKFAMDRVRNRYNINIETYNQYNINFSFDDRFTYTVNLIRQLIANY